MPASIDRSTVIRGPGTVQLDTVQMFDRDGITADVAIETFDVSTSAHGLVDTRRRDAKGKISFRPCGAITANILGALYPHGTPVIGSSLLGASDRNTIVHSVAGQKVTFYATALSRMPSLKLSTTETAFAGQAEITALVANTKARTDTDSFYLVESEAWSGAFDTANIKGGVYQGTWNSITFQTAEGWDVDFEMETEEQYADGIGTYDLMLTGVKASARCTPIGVSESDLLGYLNIQGASAALGASMRSGHDLVITSSTGLTVTLKEAAVMKGPLEYGNTKLRAGEMMWTAHRAITGGVPAALFTVALTA